ncbi:MAG: peptidyl-prolyl cis-trans isomerase, partial [Betaproteobacteria bacterium]|nr:peptidyl-prolyl cis-trans isomerase [Betaproteobacteria bacterium]
MESKISPTPAAISASSMVQPDGLVSRMLREPLLHFLVLGAVMFGVDHNLNLDKDDPQTITISKSVRTEAHDIFTAGLKREPSEAEMKTLLDRWVDNEVLYREGLALGLDRGDTTIRDRIIFKALSLTQSGLTLPKIDEAGVRKWFESKRDRYDTPIRFNFLEAAVTSDRSPEALAR